MKKKANEKPERKKPKKLQLSRETLRALESAEARQVVGGAVELGSPVDTMCV